MTAVDVVVVTADTRKLVLACLDRLHDPQIAHVIVVDNASRDGTAEAVHARHPATTVVRVEEPVGFASACNRGAERGEADLILFLNSDILALDGAIATLAAELVARPDAVAAGGRLVDPGTLATQDRYGPKPFPTLTTFAVRLSGIEQLWPRNPWTLPPPPHVLAAQTAIVVDQPAGACLLVRRDAFDALAGFDEFYWFWYEDVDLARRLADRGTLLYVPAAVFEHVGGASFARWDRAQSVRSLVQGIAHYAEVHFSLPGRLGLAALLLALSAPRSLLFARSDPDLARAHRAIVRAALRLARGECLEPLV
jgi:N-acetylglucosaminyl-diphospho-decaprenol L-rhamnosyltransferase